MRSGTWRRSAISFIAPPFHEKLQHFALARGKLSPREASWPGEKGTEAASGWASKNPKMAFNATA